MKRKLTTLQRAASVPLAGWVATPAMASSHMDAPLITRDPSANTTDVYAFVHEVNGTKFLVTALGVYPHEEPGIGPNKYNFDDTALYEIHIATGPNVAAGRSSISYQFRFTTQYRNTGTILQSYLGVVNDVGDASQNLIQTYTVNKVVRRGTHIATTALGTGTVPPNNQGVATPFYNQGNNGENPAKDGVSSLSELDRYTQQSISRLPGGYVAFAGQRDDGFYGDIQSIFDLLQLRSPGKDAQGGFNIHLIALAIPVSELGGDQQIAGVYASVSRQPISVLGDSNSKSKSKKSKKAENWVQVSRQGNPLFNEALVAIADKDLYSRTTPESDASLFRRYAENPELAGLINTIVFGGTKVAPETNRTDLVGIFIPDLIKVDLSTGSARLAGSGFAHPTNPDDTGYSRLSIFGNDVLTSAIQDGFGGGIIPGGWPNGRRFGDDVVDIAVSAILSDLRGPIVIRVADGVDGVSKNDIGYNKTFPYEGTPQNGRNHTH